MTVFTPFRDAFFWAKVHKAKKSKQKAFKFNIGITLPDADVSCQLLANLLLLSSKSWKEVGVIKAT